MAFTIVTDTLPIFPTDLSFGRPGGPEYLTDAAILESGHEQRNAYWEEPRYSWEVGYGTRTIDKITALLDFFHKCKGKKQPFRFKDWLDYKSCQITGSEIISYLDQALPAATAGQTQFQLIKTYGTADPYMTVVDIIKPRGDTIVIAVDSVEETSGWTVNEVTGIIERSSGLSGGEIVTWGGEFWRKARFDVDKLSHSFDAWKAGTVDVPVIGLRGT